MKYCYLFLIAILYGHYGFGATSSLAYPFKYRLETLSMNQGLSQHDISSIAQDRYGFIWIATYDGLLRYDGYVFKVFRYDETDPSSISDNRILTIYVDSSQNLWIGTEGGGLNLYNYQLENFTNFRFSENTLDNNIYCIYEDKTHNLWATTNYGVYQFSYSVHTRQIEKETILSEFEEMAYVRTMYKNHLNDVLLGTYNGIYLASFNKKNSSKAYGIPKKIPLLSSAIFAFEELTSHNLLLGGNEGLFIYNHDTQLITPLSTSGIKPLYVRSIKRQNDSTFLIGTEAMGILTMTYAHGKYTLNKLETDREQYLEKALIKTLFIDNMQNLWIGTGGNGVGRLNLLSPTFYRLFDTEKESGNFVRSFYKDTHDRMWVQIKRNKLFYMQNGKKAEISIPVSHTANSITEDKKGNIWISTSDEIYLLHQTSDFQQPQPVIASTGFPLKDKKINNIRGIQSDGIGNIWIGYMNGLMQIKNYGTPSVEFKIYDNFNLKNNQININLLYFEKHANHLWACTRDFGIFLFELNSQGDIVNQTRFYLSNNSQEQISSNHVWAVAQSSSGEIWIGTDAGLNSITFVDGKIKIRNFNHIEQLKNIKILSIIEDDQQNLWLATSIGLISFNPMTNEVNHFYHNDGLSSNSIMEMSQKDANGMIYFATINGITCFYPNEIKPNPIKPQVLFTSFRVFNEEIQIGEKRNGRVLLPQSILNTKKIKLKYNENNFTVNYVGIHFNNPRSNKFAHQLVGYDRDWVYGDSEKRSASYNNLNPGIYQLRVKAANSDRVWTDGYQTIDIEIMAAPWVTWWAYLIYITCTLGLIYIIVVYYKKQEHLKYKLHIEQLERLHDKEMNDHRLKFHTNITHEIKTPLTLITAPLQELMQYLSNDEFTSSRLQFIQQNTIRLSNLINQFLDLRKIDKESLPLCVKETNITRLFHVILHNFQPLALQKNIDLQHPLTSPVINGWIDEDKVSKILNNLLTNAIKFTPNGKKITLSVYEEGEGNLLFTVEDTGCGMDEKELPHIFERFYQCSNHTSSGTGIGLSLVYELVKLHHGEISVTSTKGVGSKFTVSIPTRMGSYAANEISQLSCLPHQGESDSFLEDKMMDEIDSKQIVLVVEDDHDMREYLYQCLSPHFEVLTEDNANSGYQTALKYVPNLILTDIMMPEVDGLEFCDKLKNDFHTSHIPVVILTAKSAEDDLLKGYQAGAEVYLTKPFNPDRLILQLKNMITFRKRRIGEEALIDEADTKETDSKMLILNEREQKFINKLNNWLEQHLEETDYNIEDICREIGTSRMQLHRKLTAIIGQSASEFIRAYKMRRAKELLESGNYNVSEVVWKIGFKSNSHFTKTFKSVYGYPPSDLLC